MKISKENIIDKKIKQPLPLQYLSEIYLTLKTKMELSDFEFYIILKLIFKTWFDFSKKSKEYSIGFS